VRGTDNRAKRRCSRCGIKASFYCLGCSTFDNRGNEVHIEVLCGTQTTRKCYHDHCMEVYSVDPVADPQPQNFVRTPANVRDVRRRIT
jgi:hypothetical protein